MHAHTVNRYGDLLILVSFGIGFCFIGGIAKLCVEGACGVLCW